VPPVLQIARSDAKTDYYELTTRPASLEILPGLKTEVWGYNGILPGPTIEARSGRRAVLCLRNALPVPVVNHLHGGRTPSESDGYPTDFVLPVGGFTPSHAALSGASMNMSHDRMARTSNGEREYVYPNNQRAATLWYHDHRMDFTAPQVWRGLAGFYLIRDDVEARLPLPYGQKEIPLLLCDRSFDADGSLLYPSLDKSLRSQPGASPDYMGGVLGDVMLANGAPWPKLEVANTKYRFRVLNACNARRLELALDPAPPGVPAFLQIGSDGGLLGAPLPHRTIRIAPAERFDLILDFSRYHPGAKITLRNKAIDGRMGEILQFHVTRSEKDDTIVPPRLATDLVFPRLAEVKAIRHFDFSYKGARGWTINGKPFEAGRMDAQPELDSTEIWKLQTDFSHPLHLHLVHFQVLSHSGRPGPYDAGWKDTIALGPGEEANILVRFQGYRGRYVFHCHNLEHEDMAMMGNFEVV
jgi:spore coat protein A